jgi:hypothetical protein
MDINHVNKLAHYEISWNYVTQCSLKQPIANYLEPYFSFYKQLEMAAQ